MREGFIFDHSVCVNCKACVAACILYNDFPMPARNVYTNNQAADPLLPVISLSLACNHCETAVCMKGCPSSAYQRDPVTGAVIIDELKCIGCKYCQWNCPYDAPKFDPVNRTISKCNLCNSILLDGGKPACSSACPTGALSYGELVEESNKGYFSWFPDKNINPAISFSSEINTIPLVIIPERETIETESESIRKGRSNDSSLIAFSFLSTYSVATLISSFIKGNFSSKSSFISILLIAALSSLLHLGTKVRLWRAIANLKDSPLSREIAAFIIYASLSSFAIISQAPSLIVIASFTGLVFLFLIDNVYIFSTKSKSVFLHSGQAFISSLIIISFLSGLVIPFVFLAALKLISSIIAIVNNRDKNIFTMRFGRLVFLILPLVCLVSGIAYPVIFVSFIFLFGELIDRILFYIDFKPLSINNSIR